MTIQEVITKYFKESAIDGMATVTELGYVIQDEMGIPFACHEAVINALFDSAFLTIAKDGEQVALQE